MRLVKGTVLVAVAMAVIGALTVALWYGKRAGLNLHHPVFFYLLPLAFVAMVFGSLSAMLCTAAAIACAAFFLYDPTYSFYVANTLELGDLICFAVLALIGIKCTVELSRPMMAMPAPKPRYGRTRLPSLPQ